MFFVQFINVILNYDSTYKSLRMLKNCINFLIMILYNKNLIFIKNHKFFYTLASFFLRLRKPVAFMSCFIRYILLSICSIAESIAISFFRFASCSRSRWMIISEASSFWVFSWLMSNSLFAASQEVSELDWFIISEEISKVSSIVHYKKKWPYLKNYAVEGII